MSLKNLGNLAEQRAHGQDVHYELLNQFSSSSLQITGCMIGSDL